MPGAAEFAQVEARIARMADAELVDMNDHPEDYEPWALELGRVEMGRRKIEPDRLAGFRQELSAEATKDTRLRDFANHWLAVKLLGLGVVLALAGWQGIRNLISWREAVRLSASCAAMLSEATGRASAGSAIKIGAHSIALTVSVEAVDPLSDGVNSAAVIQVACELDGHDVPALMSSTVGIGSTRDRALAQALKDWVQGQGMPIVAALSGKPSFLRAGDFVVHGTLGIRGHRPAIAEDVHEQFLLTVAPALSSLSRTSFHTVSAIVRSSPGVAPTGDFRLDNQASSQLKRLALQVPWPKGESPYVLSHFYVLAAADSQASR